MNSCRMPMTLVRIPYSSMPTKDYLIVLNNGEPFYTDFDIFEDRDDENETIRDGQLYNFLAKGKSLKRNDIKKLGKYGPGSKLLCTSD